MEDPRGGNPRGAGRGEGAAVKGKSLAGVGGIGEDFPRDATWKTGSYQQTADMVRSLVPTLDSIERGRADQWIKVWHVPIGEDGPLFAEATECSRQKEFLSKHQSECWYYVRFRMEVAGVATTHYVRCKARAEADGGNGESREKQDLLRMLDTQTALAAQEGERANASRDDAARWHAESLAKDVKIAMLDIKVAQLEHDLAVAVAEQAPILSDEAGEKLFTKGLELLKLWGLTPTDKGLAAKALKATLKLMLAIQNDSEIVRLLLVRHRGTFAEFIGTFNQVAESLGLLKQAELELPRMPRLSAKKKAAHARS